MLIQQTVAEHHAVEERKDVETLSLPVGMCQGALLLGGHRYRYCSRRVVMRLGTPGVGPEAALP